MSFLRVWLLMTGALLALGMIWAFAPILVPLFAVFIGLGAVVAAIVAAARALERWRGSAQPPK